MGREFGITDRQLQELPNYRESDAFNEDERLVLDLAVAMTHTPAVVSDELRQRLAARFSSAQLTELAAAIAWENHRARINRALGVRSMGITEGSVCAVPEGLMGDRADG